MLIYTPKITSRIQYSFQLIFDTVWKMDYQLTEDVEVFHSHQGAKLNYSNKQLADIPSGNTGYKVKYGSLMQTVCSGFKFLNRIIRFRPRK